MVSSLVLVPTRVGDDSTHVLVCEDHFASPMWLLACNPLIRRLRPDLYTSSYARAGTKRGVKEWSAQSLPVTPPRGKLDETFRAHNSQRGAFVCFRSNMQRSPHGSCGSIRHFCLCLPRARRRGIRGSYVHRACRGWSPRHREKLRSCFHDLRQRLEATDIKRSPAIESKVQIWCN